MNYLNKKELVINSDFYFYTQGKSLEQRLSKISLSKEEEASIILTKTKKTLRDKGLGLFKVGEVISTILNWNDEIDGDLKEAKKEFLLASYFDKADQLEDSLEKIKQLLISPQGNTIFNKILRILDNTPPDIELTEHLSKTLIHIVNTNFNALFEDHKFALNQIEMLTPQALTVLVDYKSWPSWKLNAYAASLGRITSPWLQDFVAAYAMLKQITDYNTKQKISHSINDLIKNRYVEAMQTTQESTGAVCLTDIGKLIVKYIE